MGLKALKSMMMVAMGAILFVSCCEQQTVNNQPENSLQTINPPDTTDQTNNFYDNAEDHILPFTGLSIEGEISNPGEVDFDPLPLHTVIVKETLLSENGDSFIGAYRYDGYSLYDILNQCNLDKNNKKDFAPIIDLYVEIQNEKGEKAIVSWGEIYYPNHLHEILIATRVMRIVPSKTNDLWPLPSESKLVVASDLITERNISSPAKISVKSWPKSLPTVKGMSTMYAPEFGIFLNDEPVETLRNIPAGMEPQTYHTIFYGRGRGIHSTQPFTGYMIKEIIGNHLQVTRENLQTGMIVMAGEDGYRGVYTFSEVMNRNDQSEFLLVHAPEEKDGGAFRIFPAADFFSDRAIKSLKSIYIAGK